MHNFIKSYEDSNEEKFNEEFIFMKNNDNVLNYINDIAKALEVIDGITFLGGYINNDESAFKSKEWLPVKESRLSAIVLKFKIEGLYNKQPKSEIIEKVLFFPKLINNFYFLLNGNKYFPIYQIIDSATYHTSKNLTLKTLLMPIIIKTEVEFFQDVNMEYECEGKMFILDLFKYKINILNYYFAKFGVNETIKYFGFSKDELGISKDITDESNFMYFTLNNNLYLYVNRDSINNDFVKNFIVTCIKCFEGLKTKSTNLDNIDYWKKKLGALFTKNVNNQVEKAEQIIISFQRILDDRTKKILRISDENKEDSFAIVRWMTQNYEILRKKDNMDLTNKRFRVNEYLLHPLLIKFSNGTYRLLNSKTITFSSLKSIFNNISPNFIIKKLITNELLRYVNSVNAIELYSSALKMTIKGPQSLAEGSKAINIRYRGLHSSYLGRVGLTSSSSSDPGTTMNATPFIETDGFYFVKKNELD